MAAQSQFSTSGLLPSCLLQTYGQNFLKYGKNAKKFSEEFHWDKVVINYLRLIN